MDGPVSGGNEGSAQSAGRTALPGEAAVFLAAQGQAFFGNDQPFPIPSGKAAGNVLLTDSFGETTLLGYFVTDALLKALAFVFYALAACTISTACKNVTFSFVLSFLVCVTPLFVLDNSGSVLVCASVLRQMYPPEMNIAAFVGISAYKCLVIGSAALFAWSRKADCL